MSGADTRAALAVYAEILRARAELEEELAEFEALAASGASESGSDKEIVVEPRPVKPARGCCGWLSFTR